MCIRDSITGDEMVDPYPDEIIVVFLSLLCKYLLSHIVNGVFPEPPTTRLPTIITLAFEVNLLK